MREPLLGLGDWGLSVLSFLFVLSLSSIGAKPFVVLPSNALVDLPPRRPKRDNLPRLPCPGDFVTSGAGDFSLCNRGRILRETVAGDTAADGDKCKFPTLRSISPSVTDTLGRLLGRFTLGA
jgi:hypothetical protein